MAGDRDEGRNERGSDLFGGTASEQLPRQLSLDLSVDPALSRDDLVETPSNRHAVGLADAWPRWASSVAIIHGARGSGKSHLAQIWGDRSAAVRGRADAVAADLIATAGRGGSVVIEDLDQGAVDETGLFHLLNAARQGGGSVLLTARLAPAAWSIRLPDLVSRLRAATLAEMDAPDDFLLEAVLFKQFSDRQMSLDPAVAAYLLKRMERSLSFAARLAAALDDEALSRGAPVTLPLARDVLGRLRTD